MALRFFTLVLSLLVFMSASAYAVDYTIRNLAVDVEGDNAIDAREKALKKARANAFNILKKRVSAEGADIPTPDANTIASMVNSFEINREKLSKNRYLASVNVSFNERAVQAYVGRYSNTATPDYGIGQDPFASHDKEGVLKRDRDYKGMTDGTFSAYGNRNERMPSMQSARPLTQSTVRIDVSGIKQWINVKKMLESVYSVQDVEVEQLSSRHAVVNLKHQGTINELQGSLIGVGMRLYTNTDVLSKDQAPYILVTRG